MDGKVLNKYIEIYENVMNGNWSYATTIGVENNFDAYELIACTKHFEEVHGIDYMSYSDVAILSMYIERKKYELIEKEWINR